MKRSFFISFALVLLSSAGLHAGEEAATSRELTADKIIEKSQLAFYSQGDDMKARVTMDLIDSKGGVRKRVMSMLRRNTDSEGDQKYFIYFHEPGDVRQMTFMVWKYPEKEDDRWIFVPAVDLIRRIAADDSRSSFVGSDFTYEDISGRDVTSDTHKLLGEEALGERMSYMVESVPLSAGDYARKVSWIDKETFLPLKESYYDSHDRLFREFTADRIETIVVEQAGGTLSLPTVTKRTMTNIKRDHRTEVNFDSVVYNIDLNDKDFSERNMRRPPRAWIN